MANILQPICLFSLIVLVFLKSGEAKTKNIGCKKCLLHCKTIAPNTLSEGICRSCLECCKHQTKDLFLFFKNHRCLINNKDDNTLQVESPLPSDVQEKMQTMQRFCQRAHQDLMSSFSDFLMKYYKCTNDLKEAKKKAFKCLPSTVKHVDEADTNNIEEMFRENRNRFTNETKLPNTTHIDGLSNIGKRETMARVGEITDAGMPEEDEEQPVCTTIYEPITPTHARRHSPREIVRLSTYNGLQQFFHSGRCVGNTTVVTLKPAGRCKTVYNLHKAFFTLTGQRYDPLHPRFAGCFKPANPNSTTIYCNDWVRIESSCAFFV